MYKKGHDFVAELDKLIDRSSIFFFFFLYLSSSFSSPLLFLFLLLLLHYYFENLKTYFKFACYLER